jgi:hypothetical protein
VIDVPSIYLSVHASEWDVSLKEYSAISLDPPSWALYVMHLNAAHIKLGHTHI